MPVAGVTCLECPTKIAPRQSRSHFWIIRDVVGVVVVDETILHRPAKREKNGNREDKTEDPKLVTTAEIPPVEHDWDVKTRVGACRAALISQISRRHACYNCVISADKRHKLAR